MGGSSRPKPNMEKKKKKTAESPSTVNLIVMVKSQDGREMFYKIKRHTKLKKLLITYCDCRFLEFDQTRFLIDGNFFNTNKTPHELGLEDGCQIEVMIEQMGGGVMVM